MNYHFNVGSKPFVSTRKLFQSKTEDLLNVFTTSSEIQHEKARRKEELTKKMNVNKFCLDELECENMTLNEQIESQVVKLVEV